MSHTDHSLEEYEERAFRLATKLRIKDSLHRRERIEALLLEDLLLAANDGRVVGFKCEQERTNKIMAKLLTLLNEGGTIEEIRTLAKNVILGPEAYCKPDSGGQTYSPRLFKSKQRSTR